MTQERNLTHTGRERLFALFALLLFLPLIGLVSYVLFGEFYANPDSIEYSRSMRLVPMLTADARMGLLTYKQPCGADEDCERPLHCFFNMLSQRSYCADSTCLDDLDCLDEFACRAWVAWNGRSLIRT